MDEDILIRSLGLNDTHLISQNNPTVQVTLLEEIKQLIIKNNLEIQAPIFALLAQISSVNDRLDKLEATIAAFRPKPSNSEYTGIHPCKEHTYDEFSPCTLPPFEGPSREISDPLNGPEAFPQINAFQLIGGDCHKNCTPPMETNVNECECVDCNKNCTPLIEGNGNECGCVNMCQTEELIVDEEKENDDTICTCLCLSEHRENQIIPEAGEHVKVQYEKAPNRVTCDEKKPVTIICVSVQTQTCANLPSKKRKAAKTPKIEPRPKESENRVAPAPAGNAKSFMAKKLQKIAAQEKPTNYMGQRKKNRRFRKLRGQHSSPADILYRKKKRQAGIFFMCHTYPTRNEKKITHRITDRVYERNPNDNREIQYFRPSQEQSKITRQVKQFFRNLNESDRDENVKNKRCNNIIR